jgi:hypothetical protein
MQPFFLSYGLDFAEPDELEIASYTTLHGNNYITKIPLYPQEDGN